MRGSRKGMGNTDGSPFAASVASVAFAAFVAYVTSGEGSPCSEGAMGILRPSLFSSKSDSLLGSVYGLWESFRLKFKQIENKSRV